MIPSECLCRFILLRPMNKQWRATQTEMRKQLHSTFRLLEIHFSVHQDVAQHYEMENSFCVYHSIWPFIVVAPLVIALFILFAPPPCATFFAPLKFRRLLMASVPITLCHCVFCLISTAVKRCLMCPPSLSFSTEEFLSSFDLQAFATLISASLLRIPFIALLGIFSL